jgi:hypothetical protein
MDLLAKLRFTNIPSWSRDLPFIMPIIIGLLNTMVFFVGLTRLRIAIGEQGGNYQSGNVFNDQMIRRELDGRRTVSQQFLWEVTKRVYFCFDLKLMLRTMMDECPQLALDGPVGIGEGGK